MKAIEISPDTIQLDVIKLVVIKLTANQVATIGLGVILLSVAPPGTTIEVMTSQIAAVSTRWSVGSAVMWPDTIQVAAIRLVAVKLVMIQLGTFELGVIVLSVSQPDTPEFMTSQTAAASMG